MSGRWLESDLTGKVLDVLRGESKSIRYRFGTVPKEWLIYAFYRFTGRSWIDFYSDRMDRNAEAAMDSPISPRYLEAANDHAEFLKRSGLEPQHDFLDYGCGIMRLAIPLVPYLTGGSYVGVDISSARLAKGMRLLTDKGVSQDRCQVVKVSECSLRELGDMRFDVVWANSVFTHMPMNDIRTMLKALRRHLKADGRFFFSFSSSGKYERKNVKDFWHPPELMRETCQSLGYRFELRDDWDQARFKDLLACASLAEPRSE